MKRNRVIVLVVSLLVVTSVALTAATMARQHEHGDVEQRLSHVRSELDGVKADLPMYSCCINPACNFCALTAGMCPCGDNVTTETGVCGECFLGWEAGIGHVEGVEADQVRMIHGDMLQMMYDKLSEHFSGHTHEHEHGESSTRAR